MATRILLAVAALALTAAAIWHPAPHPAIGPAPQVQAPPAAGRRSHRHGRPGGSHLPATDLVVYVAGSVNKPGLYHLRPGARAADAVAAAGGLSAGADAAGVNLAAHVQDGDEIDAPALGQPRRAPSRSRHLRRRRAPSPAPAAVDVNAAGAPELAAVPGIGRTIAQRIVDMRERDGAFGSLDELLDVAGMTQTRLDRAQPYLQPP
ncbi:MAG TPA: helix-hairpin-helix domain-containing protein [Candidatus Baltobacteraceae bacterium]|nr:helix-hairpin-helix domain-containing protein [Candidatus Baltobacteraceae bacterium]